MEEMSRRPFHEPTRAPPREVSDAGEEDDDEEDSEDPDEGPEEATSDDEPLFALSHCRQHEQDGHIQYAFQIAYAEMKMFGIRIKNGEPISCNCPEGDEPCRHKDWLLQKLRTGPVDSYAQISARGLGNICTELHWELRGVVSEPKEEWRLEKHSSTFGMQTRSLVRERTEAVKDIMDTLTPLPVFTVTTDQSHEDIFNSLAPEAINQENTFVANNLEATLARLLMSDDRLFQQFDLLVPKDSRAANHFNKMERRARIACQRLDAYNEKGPVIGQYTVIWCADELNRIVESIYRNLRERHPLPPDCKEHAADVLVSILEMVVLSRNKEMYQNIRWVRHKRHGELAVERNLYLRLIGSPSPANPDGDTFVLRALRDLPETRPHVERLQEILRRVEGVGEYIGWKAAPPYTTQTFRASLIALITQLTGRPPSTTTPDRPGPSAGPGKRSAGSSSTGRDAKRSR